MNLSDLILRGDFGTAQDDLSGILLGLLIAFLCGHVVAWVYMACHSGLSYSRSFVNSLIVLCVIVALVMAVVVVAVTMLVSWWLLVASSSSLRLLVVVNGGHRW
jgi:predicted PurR-regulated permease PerM